MSVFVEQHGVSSLRTNTAVELTHNVDALPVRPLAPGRLVQLTAEEVAAGNALYSSPALRCDNLQWRWRLPPPMRVRHWLRFAAAGNDLHIGLQHDVVGLNGAALDWLAQRGVAQLLAWSVMHEPLIELLQSVFGLDFVLQTIGEEPQQRGVENDLCIGFQIRRDDDVTVTSGQACFPAEWLAALLARAGEQSAATEPAWDGAWARLPCVIDSLSMAPVELEALSVGCIVRLDNASLRDGCARVALDGGATWLISNTSGMDLTVVEISQLPASDSTLFRKELTRMNNDPHEPRPNGTAQNDAAEQQPQLDSAARRAGQASVESVECDAIEKPGTVDAAAVPVALRFEAGVVTLPYGELRSIRPGYVFHLNKRLQDQLIAVYANNMQVAVGELVCVGDLVGVRITDMHVEKTKTTDALLSQ